MKLLVTGGRAYADRELVFIVLDRLHREAPITELIHGACGWDSARPDEQTMLRLRGADGLADAWARERGVPVTRVPAPWTTMGGGGGPWRNRRMLDLVPDLVVAFPGGTGTNGCVAEALRRGIVVEHASRDGKDAFESFKAARQAHRKGASR